MEKHKVAMVTNPESPMREGGLVPEERYVKEVEIFYKSQKEVTHLFKADNN